MSWFVSGNGRVTSVYTSSNNKPIPWTEMEPHAAQQGLILFQMVLFSRHWFLNPLFQAPPLVSPSSGLLAQQISTDSALFSAVAIRLMAHCRDPFTKGSWAHNPNLVKIFVALTWKIMIRSCHSFAHATTAMLSWHVQNSDMIELSESKL